ncbi:MAG TPA: MBL fold metallo-hydrolase [Gaiella sp.]|jgi:glyoxylase-like metal-dependent hydrolase (beta-lactamase superfamily II)
MEATPPPPVVEKDPREVADGVYVIPDGRVPLVPNVGIVVGDRAALVIDTGMGPRNGAIVRSHADRLAAGRQMFLTLTHFHPEHGYGAQAFAGDAVTVYNRAQLDELRAKGAGYVELFKTFGAPVAAELEGVELVEPEIVYDGTAELELGGSRALLRDWGRAHTLGDQTVFLPEQRVLFTGDLVEERCFAIFPWFPPDDVDVDGHRWIEVLEELERLDPAIVVPGHGDVGGPELIATAREYLELLRDETARLADEGATEDDLAAELDRSLRALHPDWAQPEWIAFGARCFYTAYTREPAARS